MPPPTQPGDRSRKKRTGREGAKYQPCSSKTNVDPEQSLATCPSAIIQRGSRARCSPLANSEHNLTAGTARVQPLSARRMSAKPSAASPDSGGTRTGPPQKDSSTPRCSRSGAPPDTTAEIPGHQKTPLNGAHCDPARVILAVFAAHPHPAGARLSSSCTDLSGARRASSYEVVYVDYPIDALESCN
ncbi:hypothetical protein NDU88_006047 [Pleurodeles waltl]|uniref:Uncharacterized protein n=1 Tax=Pleurodeles waltl TaxID=8319 RepID=A0AAV7WCT6_PLEWA|nr:hypothetical protein NDU88_006047 [Pleurodeles waltl]